MYNSTEMLVFECTHLSLSFCVTYAPLLTYFSTTANDAEDDIETLHEISNRKPFTDCTVSQYG